MSYRPVCDRCHTVIDPNDQSRADLKFKGQNEMFLREWNFCGKCARIVVQLVRAKTEVTQR